MFTGAYAPIGYKKDPDQQGHLLVDEETAWIVRKIFDWAREGWGAQRIKTQLEAEKIPTPTWWNRQRGLRNYHGRFEREDNATQEGACVWGLTTIKKLLTQPVYIGAVAAQKSITRFKVGWLGYRPMDEWVIVEGMHEPIIDRQTWDIVQEKIKSRKRPDDRGEFSIFSGLLKCSTCGKTCTARYNSQRRKVYSCLTYNRYGKNHCTSHAIFGDQLYDALLQDIKEFAAIALEDEEAVVDILSKRSVDDDLCTQMKSQHTVLMQRKQELDTMMDRLYLDWTNGRLNEDNFNRMSANTQAQQEELKRQISELEEKLLGFQEEQDRLHQWAELVKKYAGIQELTAEVMNELISKIVIYEPEEVQGQLVQDIEIHYTFEVDSCKTITRPRFSPSK